MSEIICSGCGRQTISSMSIGVNEKNSVECFVAFEKDKTEKVNKTKSINEYEKILYHGKAVKGCGYDTADSVSKKLADDYIVWANKILSSLDEW
jgi:hypothetical protein